MTSNANKELHSISDDGETAVVQTRSEDTQSSYFKKEKKEDVKVKNNAGGTTEGEMSSYSTYLQKMRKYELMYDFKYDPEELKVNYEKRMKEADVMLRKQIRKDINNCLKRKAQQMPVLKNKKWFSDGGNSF